MIVAACIFFISIGLFMFNVSVDNREIDLRNLFDAQNSVREANYDKMWKSIAEIVNVPKYSLS